MALKAKGILFSSELLQASPFVPHCIQPVQQNRKNFYTDSFQYTGVVIRGNIGITETCSTGISVCKDRPEKEITVCTLLHLSFTICFLLFFPSFFPPLFYLQLCLLSYFYSKPFSQSQQSLKQMCRTIM